MVVILGKNKLSKSFLNVTGLARRCMHLRCHWFLFHCSAVSCACSCTHIYNKATGPEGGFEWLGEFRMCCNRQPTPFCVLDKGRQSSPHVSRQFIWSSPCHTWGYTQDSGCATWGCWVLSVLCSECSWLHHCESILTGLTHSVHPVILTIFTTSGYLHYFLSFYNLSICFSIFCLSITFPFVFPYRLINYWVT
jgi:hypothetical protein